MLSSFARAVTLATVFFETPQLFTMFRSLNPRLLSLRISRYLVIKIDLLYLYSHPKVRKHSIKDLCVTRAESGSELPEWWLRKSRQVVQNEP